MSIKGQICYIPCMDNQKSQNLTNSSVSVQKKLTFLTALCLFFSAVEFAIPKPVPFLRLGLANLAVILSFFLLTPWQSIILIALKVFVQNLISGTLFSYTVLFSIAGSFSSGLVMLALFKLLYNCPKPKISLAGICLTGSFFNCLAQLLVSYFLMFHENTKYIAPVLLGLSFITGILLGLFAEYFVRHSKWFRAVRSQEVNE